MQPFINEEEGRIRAFWRLILQVALMVFLMIIVALAYHAEVFMKFVSLGAILVSVWVAGRYLDHRPFRGFGMQMNASWWESCGVGFLIGGGAMSGIFLWEWSMGWVHITGLGWQRVSETPFVLNISGYFLLMTAVGFQEELLFRGYQLRNLSEGFNLESITSRQAAIGAMVLTAVIFGAMHMGNPGASIVSTVNVMLAGLVLAWPYLVTGELALPIGIHVAWNFFQGGVYGFPVSGMPWRTALIQVKQQGPEWATGGSFGPEAGVAGLLGLVAVVLLYAAYLKAKGYNMKPDSSFAIYRQSGEMG